MIDAELQFETIRGDLFGRHHDTCIIDQGIQPWFLVNLLGGLLNAGETRKVQRDPGDVGVSLD